MVVPQSKSRSMTEACNVKWVDPCHWTKWRRSCVLRTSPYRRKPRRRMGFDTRRCAEHRRARGSCSGSTDQRWRRVEHYASFFILEGFLSAGGEIESGECGSRDP